MKNLFGEEVDEIKTHKLKNKNRRNWENRFQRWSDKMAQDESTPYGKCGCGAICDYCENNDFGRPCVRALNEMARNKNIIIDYSDDDYSRFF